MTLDDSPPSSDLARLRVLNPLAVADWDKQLALLPGAGFFHSAAWAGVLYDTYGYSPNYLAGSDSVGNLDSLLPLMEVDSWLTGRRGVALPFTDESAPLCRDSDSFQQLLLAAKQLGRERRWKYLELRGGKKWLPDAPASTAYFHHSLQLQSNPAGLFSGFVDPVRRAIRKAESHHLDVEFSQSLESMQVFYRLLCLTRRRHGVPPQPFPFFAQIQRQILATNQGWIVLARQGKIPVAGAVFFHFGRQAIYKFGASDETRQQLRANNLVMWQAIQHYAKAGFDRLDFGRTSLANAGLRQFKLAWGTREEPLEYLRFDFRNGNFVTARDESTGWHNRIFQSLPLPLSRLAGSLLYRHIA